MLGYKTSLIKLNKGGKRNENFNRTQIEFVKTPIADSDRGEIAQKSALDTKKVISEEEREQM